MQVSKWIDNLLFWCIIAVGEFIAVHGKAMASFIFSSSSTLLRKIEKPEIVYLAIILSAVALSLLRIARLNPKSKVLIGAFIGFLATLTTQYGNMQNANSSLIFFLQLFLYATACGVIWIECYLDFNLDKDFWKFMFENVFKAIRYILVVYATMIVILKYISSSNGEATIGFITTLSYPTFIIVLSVFMISYWVLVPSWEKYVDSSKIKTIDKKRATLRLQISRITRRYSGRRIRHR